jgi:hypothetical protein
MWNCNNKIWKILMILKNKEIEFKWIEQRKKLLFKLILTKIPNFNEFHSSELNQLLWAWICLLFCFEDEIMNIRMFD